MKRHKAPRGKPLAVISTVATVVCIGVAAVLIAGGSGPWWAACLILAIPAVAAVFTVRGYTVTAEAILIHRLVHATRLPLAGLLSARSEPDALRGSIRLLGNGGLFSFSGLFWSRSLHRYRAFVTDLHRTVVLRFPSRTFVLSPLSPEAMLNDIAETGCLAASAGRSSA